MSKKLFVGNLSWGTGEEELKSLFTVLGSVAEAKVITDRETGKSRGFAFVTMTDADDADKAISSLDGKELDGRKIKVSEAVDKPRTSSGGYRSEGGYRDRR